MPSLLIAFGILLLAGAGLALYVRKGGTKEVKDEVDPEAPRNVERRRAASEAAATEDRPLSKADAAEADELHDYFQKIGTAEFPALAFVADPLGAPIPDDHGLSAPTMFDEAWADKLSLFTWSAASTAPVSLSSVQVSEPESWQLEGPTGVFSRDWINQVMARAEASR
jgi:hypothetical protein